MLGAEAGAWPSDLEPVGEARAAVIGHAAPVFRRLRSDGALLEEFRRGPNPHMHPVMVKALEGLCGNGP